METPPFLELLWQSAQMRLLPLITRSLSSATMEESKNVLLIHLKSCLRIVLFASIQQV